MTRGMKAYVVAAVLVLGIHGTGGLRGWWKGVALFEGMSVRSSGGGSGGSGWSGGGFRGGK